MGDVCEAVFDRTFEDGNAEVYDAPRTAVLGKCVVRDCVIALFLFFCLACTVGCLRLMVVFEEQQARVRRSDVHAGYTPWKNETMQCAFCPTLP